MLLDVCVLSFSQGWSSLSLSSLTNSHPYRGTNPYLGCGTWSLGAILKGQGADMEANASHLLQTQEATLLKVLITSSALSDWIHSSHGIRQAQCTLASANDE
jgi:hypothetical protein